MFLDFLSIAIQLVAAGVLCVAAALILAVGVGIVDLATCGHSDWHEDRQEL